MKAIVERGWHWINDQPYLLLPITMLMWAGNIIASKYAIGEVSPMAIVCLRWGIVSLFLVAFRRQAIAGEMRALAPHWRIVLIMGTLAFTGFNSLFYLAAYHTTAVNMTIFQSAMPVLVLIGALFVFGVRITPAIVAGLLLTVVGVLVTASHGEVEQLLHLSLNRGDLFMLIACVIYAGYILHLRNKPKVPDLVYFTGLSLAAFVSSLPLLAAEIALGQSFWPTPTGWAVLTFIAIFPSLLAQLFFIRSVQLVGPNRAGVFTNLVPVFGIILSVLMVGEAFGLYQALAVVLVVSGILIAERR
ncbi:DMT family transporter [Chelatococcus sp. GCM10030263]|uniref:DMT family transporter n=1 Tax=Chelatococcus sp. GCM10030263 TaxID=3273387 RepID=UPI0036148D8D